MAGLVIGIAVVIVLAVGAAVIAGYRYLRLIRPAAPPAATGSIELDADRAVVTVDLTDIDARSPAAVRLLDNVAGHAFAAAPTAEHIELRDPTGRVLLVRDRTHVVPPPPAPLPQELLEPHHRPRGRSSFTPDTGVHPHFEPPPVRPHKPLADCFTLPPELRSTLRNPDDPVELVAALLGHGGDAVSVDGSVVRRGATVFIVLPFALAAPVPPEALNHAYRVFERERARNGLVVTAGHMDPVDVRRRELLAPQLRHAGPDAIQRMADAVAVGLDPERFIAPPRLVLSA